MIDLKCSKCGHPIGNVKSRSKTDNDGRSYRTWLCFRCDYYNAQFEDDEEDNDD